MQPGAAMVALQEDVPVVPVAIHGTQDWRLGNCAPVLGRVGRAGPLRGLPRGGKGYREASERDRAARSARLWDWLVEVHAQGRPKGLTPP